MVCLIRNRVKFYRKTLLDVGGRYSAYGKYRGRLDTTVRFIKKIKGRLKRRGRYLNRPFTYMLRLPMGFNIPKRLKKKFIRIRYLKNFYLILSRKNFIRFKKMSKNKEGFMIQNYLMFLEGRLFMVVYRSNGITNMFIIKSIIDLNIFYVNFKLIKWSNYILKLGDIVTIDYTLRDLIYTDLMYRVYCAVIYHSTPSFLYINYNLMYILIGTYPKKDEVKYPIIIDFYKGFEYF